LPDQKRERRKSREGEGLISGAGHETILVASTQSFLSKLRVKNGRLNLVALVYDKQT